ncbi:MAG: hypothetical protein JNK78_00135 [Planctomycetes bacterium]|nr:hypothetical protein [Planctomycetota bacterium]
MTAARPNAFDHLRRAGGAAPVVVAHRGDSEHFAENTLPAFESAARLGVAMQEFDVRATADGVLVCIHDDSLDRTTDSALRVGPGMLVAGATLAELHRFDASSWHAKAPPGALVPTLTEALATICSAGIAMIEHKAGEPQAYALAITPDLSPRCIVQSFDWEFVATFQRLVPEVGVALLGPTNRFAAMDRRAIEHATRLGAGMLHWHDSELLAEQVDDAHAAGLLVCSYTTDDDLGLLGGAAMGIDAMCTNRPTRMLDLQRRGLRRPSPSG